MENQILFGIYLVLGAYVLYKLSGVLKKPVNKYQNEIHEILNSDKYKVKGKFEE